MKKLFKLMALASAVFLLGACAEETVLTPQQAKDASPENNAIAFGTYMGKTTMSRAGSTGSIDTDKLKEAGYGFGVFAYYTGIYTYGGYQAVTYSGESSKDGSTNKFANFMFNQKVEWDESLSDSYITKWSYSPTKYWPNEVKSAAGGNEVDDQNNDTSNDPATTLQENGGNVSFFAYAPYVALSDVAIDGNGITAINKQTTLSAANAAIGDPIISYKLPTAAANKAVDLLWGTAGMNGTGVTGAANAGVQGNGDPADDKTATTYIPAILGSYRTNADLTKQTTGGTINFAFKHALAKIGGSYTGSGVGDDEDGNTPTNGLLVILDLDDLKGAESGGSLEKYLAIDALEGSSKAEWNKYNTKVTINELVIESKEELTTAGVTALDGNSLTFTTTAANFQALKNTGDFNLATGQWSNVTNDGTTAYQQTIVPSANVPGGGSYGSGTGDNSKDAIISEELAEPNTAPAKSKAGFEGLPIGVTTVAKNVYESESNPLVFIPGTKPIITFTITYTVRTYDPNLNNWYTEVKQKIKKNLYITKDVELNKQYNILMHLGLTSVKFTATVSDWDTTDATGTTTDPGAGQSPVTVYEDEVEHVYLPTNVGEPSSVAATVAVPSTGSPDAALATNVFTAGSQATAVGQVTAMTATFPGESAKNVQLSHVDVEAVDANGNLVDWVTYDGATNTFSVTENTSVDDRTATIRVIYDNVADESYSVTQRGMAVQTAVLKIYPNASYGTALTVTSDETAAQPSASTKYYTRIEGTKKHVKNDGTPVGDAKDYTTTTGYTLTAGTNTTVSGSTVTTKQNNSISSTTYIGEERTETTGVGVKGGTYDGVAVTAVKFKQNAPALATIDLTVDGKTTPQTYSASATKTGTIAVVAYFEDSNNKSAGSITVPNTELASGATADKYGVIVTADSTNGLDSFAYTAGQNNAAFAKNTGTNTLSGTIKVQYGISGSTSNSVTINQTAP